MATVKYSRPLDPDNLVRPDLDNTVDATVTATSVTLPLLPFVGGRSYVLGGRFATDSEEEFLQSFVKRITIVDNDAPKVPLVTVTGLTAKAGELGSLLTSGFEQDEDEAVIDLLFNGPDKITGSAGSDELTLFFGAGSDTVNGGDGDDAIGASPGSDILIGGKGNDFLSSAFEGDVITGGKGADTFNLLGAASTGTIINDFRTAERDVLNITKGEIFFGNDPSVDGNRPGDFVQLEAEGKSAVLFIDRDGQAFFFEPERWATIKGDIGTDLDQLIADGRLTFS